MFKDQELYTRVLTDEGLSDWKVEPSSAGPYCWHHIKTIHHPGLYHHP